MAGICTASTTAHGGTCNHLTLTVDLDGEQHVLAAGVNDEHTDWTEPLSDLEKKRMLWLLTRWWKSKGHDMKQFSGRVICGEEATNVKAYNLFGPGAAITRSNIGTTYVNISSGANGERSLVDFTGCTEFRAIMSANLAGTGAFGIRIIRDGDNTVLYENANLTQTGERELDTDWTAIPVGFSGLTLLRAQAKSATATDDPVFRRCVILMR